jgi:4-amino-4-deoxy-L-arabinose transferase-like glycosyltransferase
MCGDGVRRDGWSGNGPTAPGGAEPATQRTILPAPLNKRLQAGLWLLLVAFAIHGVFGHSLWVGNDSREGGMIWDMYHHGTWVTPTINGKPFLEKPPLLHWTALVFCHLAGKVSEGLVRLPAALYGLGTLVLLYLFVVSRAPGDLARPAAGRQLAAWAAVFMCGTAIEFHVYSRVVLTDMALTFMVTLSLFLFWRAWRRPGTGRWLLFLLVAAAAFYGKGLIGPVLIWSAVGAFLAWKRRFRLLAGLAVAYVPLLLILVLPWVFALYDFAGESAVRFVFWDNQVGRFFHFSDATLPRDPFSINKEPLYYYLLHLPVYLTPWTLLFVPTFATWWRRTSPFREQLDVFIRCALAGMFLILHASTSKIVNYALPAFPLLFMMVGTWLVDASSRPRPTWLERWCVGLTVWGVAVIFSLIPVGFVVGTSVRPDLLRTGGTAAMALSIFLAVALVTFVVAGGTGLRRLASSGKRSLAFGLAPAAAAIAAIAVLQLVTPPLERRRSIKPIAAMAAAEARRGRTVALADGLAADIGAFTFYLDRRLPILKDGGEVAAYLSAAEPRAVIVPEAKLHSAEVELANLPYARRVAGSPGTVSREFVLLVNRPGEGEAAGAVTNGAEAEP